MATFNCVSNLLVSTRRRSITCRICWVSTRHFKVVHEVHIGVIHPNRVRIDDCHLNIDIKRLYDCSQIGGSLKVLEKSPVQICIAQLENFFDYNAGVVWAWLCGQKIIQFVNCRGWRWRKWSSMLLFLSSNTLMISQLKEKERGGWAFWQDYMLKGCIQRSTRGYCIACLI